MMQLLLEIFLIISLVMFHLERFQPGRSWQEADAMLCFFCLDFPWENVIKWTKISSTCIQRAQQAHTQTKVLPLLHTFKPLLLNTFIFPSFLPLLGWFCCSGVCLYVCLWLTYGFISCSRGEPCNCAWIIEAGVDTSMGAPWVLIHTVWCVCTIYGAENPHYFVTHTLAQQATKWTHSSISLSPTHLLTL